MLKATVVLLCVVGATLAALARAPLEPKPDKFQSDEGCYISKLDDVIPFGGAEPSTSECFEYQCHETHVLLVSCGVLDKRSECYKDGELGAVYPNCCPSIRCDE